MWVYEIGTSPYFSNVAPGEVTDVPAESTQQGRSEGYEGYADARSPVYTDGQQVEYPPYEGEQIELHAVQYQRRQPDNPEVVVVDDTDINVDGKSAAERLSNTSNFQSALPLLFLLCFPCFQSSRTTSGRVRTTEISAPSFLTARTTPVDTAATADLASMAMGYSVWQRVTLRFCFNL